MRRWSKSLLVPSASPSAFTGIGVLIASIRTLVTWRTKACASYADGLPRLVLSHRPPHAHRC